jgi:hypothetical protein
LSEGLLEGWDEEVAAAARADEADEIRSFLFPTSKAREPHWGILQKLGAIVLAGAVDVPRSPSVRVSMLLLKHLRDSFRRPHPELRGQLTRLGKGFATAGKSAAEVSSRVVRRYLRRDNPS